MMTVEPYRVSFTAGGLFLRESAQIAELYLQLKDWGRVRDEVLSNNLLQIRTRASGLRVSRELCDRLMCLEDDDLRALADGNAHERAALLWLAVCRQYQFVYEFANEVLYTRFMTFQRELSYDEFDAFFNARAAWHSELDSLTKATQAKLRQVLFRIMREAGLLNDAGVLLPMSLSPRVAKTLTSKYPEYLGIFNVHMDEIKELAK